ncbi:hypothetical protein BDN72DRAFT_878453 [Pluteus cervinus]|uniref:Uncharacterized protein n=1 Tax=Pluteus cervinus TaxID=181527 RepID=A0ACD3AV90_9AGAR|nr:hypothetical protein BDN72DRAFT_878453 [Pluteus cervinus]
MEDLDSAQPIFPPELEELIFSLSVQDDLKLAGRLLSVSSRVRAWMIPHIYKIVIFQYGSGTGDNIQVPYGEQVDVVAENGKHVQHMLVHSGPASFLKENIAACIARCPHLRSLALWIGNGTYSPELVESLQALRLEYLSFSIGAFTGGLEKQGRLLSSPFLSVTHLQLTPERTQLKAQQVKDYFPALTHLAMTSIYANGDKLREMLNIFRHQLRVLIWYPWTASCDGAGLEKPCVGCTSDWFPEPDPRIVILFRVNSANIWHEGVTGGFGIWRVAEEAVQARRDGAVGT